MPFPGRKPLLLIPLVGFLITSIIDLVLSVVYRDVPLEFFYLSAIGFAFGGEPIYYMGYYGYGASITTLDERASRMARWSFASAQGDMSDAALFHSKV